MKHLKALLVLAVAVCAHSQTTSTIRGIKILSSTFDPQTHVVKLTFINDTPLNITAWGYCVHTENAFGRDVNHGFRTFVDPLGVVIEDRIEMTKNRLHRETDCDRCRLIHPGEQHTLSNDLSSYPEVIGATIDLTFVAYSGGSVEVTEHGQPDLQYLRSGRHFELRARQELVELGKEVLADSNNQHPASTLIEQAERIIKGQPPIDLSNHQQQPTEDQILAATLATKLSQFKKPELNKGNQREFLPANDREYLQHFVAEQEVWVAELSKNQIMGSVQ